MRLRFVFSRVLVGSLLCGALGGCSVDFPDELPYACETNEDCGGGEHICTTLPDSRKYCCKPEPEVCNQVDDDCNAVVDDVSTGSCSN